MLRKYLTRSKSRVFLGRLAVAPRTDLKRHLEDWTWEPQADLGEHLQASLEQLFTLPPASEAVEITKQDLALDVIVQKYQSGDFLSAHSGEYSLPIFWRPKVTVCARLYFLKSKKIKNTYTATAKYPWSEYIVSFLQPRALFGFKPMLNPDELDFLLHQACYKLLLKMERKQGTSC